jgi:hypothetical protein
VNGLWLRAAGTGRQCAAASPGRRGCPALNFTVRGQLTVPILAYGASPIRRLYFWGRAQALSGIRPRTRRTSGSRAWRLRTHSLPSWIQQV